MNKKHRVLKPSFVLIICLFGNAVYAQTTTNSSSGKATNEKAGFEYVVGQVFQNDSEIHSEGMAQSFEIGVVSSLKKAEQITVEAFPNPTSRYLQIEFKEEVKKNFFYQLFDGNGKQIMRADISEKTMQIDLSTYDPGIFLLSIYRGRRLYKTFKIIKN